MNIQNTLKCCVVGLLLWITGSAVHAGFHPVDIRAVCNRGFKDEIAGDQKGGWTDQGDNDLREFPVDQKDFGGVPFRIIKPADNNGKSCIVMRGWERPYFPEEVTITVENKKCKTIYFLHAAAWAANKNRPLAYYVINFTDGKSIEIPLRSKLEVDDWWRARNQPRSLVVWQGKNQVFSKCYPKDFLGVSLFGWENPYPDIPIDSISVRSTGGMGSLAVVGITFSSERPVDTRWYTDSFKEDGWKTKDKDWEYVLEEITPWVQSVTRDSIIIMWQTPMRCGSAVQYALAPERGKNLEKDKIDNILAKGTVQNEDDEVFIHKMKLTGLLPNRRYYYRVINVDAVSPVNSNFWQGTFQTAVSEKEPFSFCVTGDTGCSPGFSKEDFYNANRQRVQERVIPNIFNHNPRFILHCGDMVGLGTRPWEWKKLLFDVWSPLLRSIPIYPVRGNHDFTFTWFWEYFAPARHKDWYSFDYGNAHFISLSDMPWDNLLPGSEQLQWLADDIASTDKRWKFVYFHVPPLTWASPSYKEIKSQINKYVIPILEKYKVDIVFSSHEHVYMRSKKGEIVYVTTGGGGSHLTGLRENPYMVYQKGIWHYTIVHIDGRHLILEARDSDGKIFDIIQITK